MKETITQVAHPILRQPPPPNTKRLYAEPATGNTGFVLYDLDEERYLLNKGRRPAHYATLLQARTAANEIARAARTDLVFAVPDGVDLPEIKDAA